MAITSTSGSSAACLCHQIPTQHHHPVLVCVGSAAWRRAEDGRDKRPGLPSLPHSGYCGCGCPHYHIHAVVPAGGLSADHQRWIHTSHPLFLLPVPTLRTVFRKNFLAGLRHLYRKDLLNLSGPAASFRDPACFQLLMEKLGNKKWYVYAKPPFGGPEHVLRYLGRYTHRMAISNHRLTAFDGERVSFRWRDYAHGGKQRVITLDAVNFLCRFFLHVLPNGFVRIRRYGLLANRFRQQLLPLARTLLAAQGREPLALPPPPDCDLWHCPRCGKAMRVVQRFTPAQLYFAGFDSS